MHPSSGAVMPEKKFKYQMHRLLKHAQKSKQKEQGSVIEDLQLQQASTGVYKEQTNEECVHSLLQNTKTKKYPNMLCEGA